MLGTLVARSPHIEHVPFILPVPGPVVVVVIGDAADQRLYYIIILFIYDVFCSPTSSNLASFHRFFLQLKLSLCHHLYELCLMLFTDTKKIIFVGDRHILAPIVEVKICCGCEHPEGTQ